MIYVSIAIKHGDNQWECQDPTDRGTVPYVWPYFVGIFPYIGLKNRPYIWNRYLQFSEMTLRIGGSSS